jgi:hypothetical protein
VSYTGGLLARVVGKGRLLPLLSVLAMAGSMAAWALGIPWLPFALGAIYLLIMQVALEKTGW